MSKTNSTITEKPKRELRRRQKSETKFEVPEEPDKYITPDEDEDENEEVSNVKLKVKVGYTATGAMIRPAVNDGRKKKRRFRNLNVKKNKVTKPTKSSQPAKETNQSSVAKKVKDEKKETPTLRPKQVKSPTKAKGVEPIPGPSGLQRVKRSPRRVLKRKLSESKDGKGSVCSEDDEDFDYVSSLYDNHSFSQPGCEDSTTTNGTPVKQLKRGKGANLAHIEPVLQQDSSDLQLNSLTDDSTKPSVITPSEEDPLAIDSVTESDPLSISSDPVELEHMQVVVIGDSDECHNYAKPHGV